MDFELSDDQREIRDVARALLAERLAGAGQGEGLWEEVLALGWPGAAAAEEHGGLDLDLVSVAVLVEELGYACAPVPLLGTLLAVLAIETAGSAAQRELRVPQLLEGRLTGSVAATDPPSPVPDAADEGLVVVLDGPRGGALIEGGATREMEAIDGRRRHGVLVDALPPGEALPGDVRVARAKASTIVSAELTGLCRRALDETVDYVSTRQQFGVPVGSFQAVQHTAASMLRATEMAAVATYHAAWVAEGEADLLPRAAAMAKAQASDAARFVTAAAIQLHGGIGFTWEADLHWLFKRAQVDAAYLGGGTYQRAQIADALIH